MKKYLPERMLRLVKPQAIAVPARRLQFPLNLPALDATSLQTLLLHRAFVASFLFGFLLTAIGIVGFDIRSNQRELQVTQQKRAVVEQQVADWETVVGSYTGYRDGFFQLAVLEYQLGHIKASHEYLTKALRIDPSFMPAKTFLAELLR